MDISRLRQQLREAGRQFDRQLHTLMEHGSLLRGNVYRLRRKCGKDGCRCTRGDLHESWVMHVREQGVQHMRAIPKGQLTKWRGYAERYKRFRQSQRELARLYRKVMKLADQLEAARAVALPTANNKRGKKDG